jgi:hypothetical protein
VESLLRDKACISSGQSSPVRIRTIVTKDEATVWKFSFIPKIPLSFTSAKRYMPRIAYTNIIRSKRLPMFVIAGSVRKNVMIVPFRVLFPLKKKRMRAILKLLIIVIYGPS